jgi:hypothetical protein
VRLGYGRLTVLLYAKVAGERETDLVSVHEEGMSVRPHKRRERAQHKGPLSGRLTA